MKCEVCFARGNFDDLELQRCYICNKLVCEACAIEDENGQVICILCNAHIYKTTGVMLGFRRGVTNA